MLNFLCGQHMFQSPKWVVGLHSGRAERSRLHCRQKFLVSLQRVEETLMTNE